MKGKQLLQCQALHQLPLTKLCKVLNRMLHGYHCMGDPLPASVDYNALQTVLGIQKLCFERCGLCFILVFLASTMDIHPRPGGTSTASHYFTLFLHLWISRPSSANSTCTTTGRSHGILGKPMESSSKNSTDKCRTWEFGSLQCQESGVAWRFWDATCLGLT